VTLTETKTYTMAQLRASKKSLYIQNNTEFLWKLSALGIQLKPFGQPGSIAHLSAAGLDHTDVLRNFAAGKITISPDLEQNLFDLETGDKTSARQNFLDQYKVEVQESAQDKGIDVKGKTEGYLETVNRKRVTPQGQALGGSVDEFINPSPVLIGESMVNPATGEVITAAAPEADTGIKSVTITRAQSLKAEVN
jgi:hypothetical protein